MVRGHELTVLIARVRAIEELDREVSVDSSIVRAHQHDDVDRHANLFHVNVPG